MQEEHLTEPYILRTKLLEAVDDGRNVKDMPLMLEVLGKLEVLPVSKEILESTRLGKTVNELRRKVNDAVLARRLKDLVKKWRDSVLIVDTAPKPRVNGSATVDGGAHPARSALLTSGYTSASSSPTLHTTSSRVSPAGSYNSNSLSPRIGTSTNYSNNNNNTSVHNLPPNRNGSSSISNVSANNHRNSHLSSAPYSTLVSPSASSASPLISSRNLVSPHKSKSPGGPSLAAFNSNISPLSSSPFQSASATYAPNSETVSRTNAANKRYIESDDFHNASTEPPLKKSRNGTLDDPLDDISRDSYASRGSDHSDGFTSKDNRFAVSVPSPTTPGQLSVPGLDSGAPSPANNLFDLEATSNQFDSTQPKRKRRKKQIESEFNPEAVLNEKLAQAQAEKAAKAARELELQKSVDRDGPLINEDSRHRFDDFTSGDKPPTGNSIVDGYLKSQNELLVRMERDAVSNDFQGAPETLSKKDKKKLKKKQQLLTGPSEKDSVPTEFPSEVEILSKLPPIDPELLAEFKDFQYDVNPSPVAASGEGGDIPTSLKETDSTNNNKSLSTLEKKPKKLIDWGDSDDDLDDQANPTQLAVDSISAQVTTEPESAVSEPLEGAVVPVSEAAPDPFQDPRRTVDESEVDRYITEHVPNLNGNYDGIGEFKEWHETLTVESYKGEPLHILPYTIIDF